MNCKVKVKSMESVSPFHFSEKIHVGKKCDGPSRKVSAFIILDNGTKIEGDFLFEYGIVDSFTEAEEEIKKLFVKSEEV